MVPDYYARLGVDPGSDPAEIEAALKKQQPVWSMGTRNPKTRHTNQLYLDEVPALRRALLSGPEARAAYDAELAAVQVAEREQKLDELQGRVRLRAAKGGLTTADRTLLRDEAARLGLDGEVLDRLTRLIPTLTTTSGPADLEEPDDDPPADVLDPSTRRQIRGALEHLGRRDLYDALGLFRDAPASIITARADEERQRWMRKAQVTAEKTAWLEIIAHAQSHLTSPKARARYDRTLMLRGRGALRCRDRLRPPGIDPSRPGNPRCADRGSRRAGDRLGAGRPADRTVLPQAGCQVRRGLGGAPARPGRSESADSQRRLPAASVSQLCGRDRGEPGGSENQPSAMPPLRSVAQMGVPGLPPLALDRRAQVRMRVPHGAARALGASFRRGPACLPLARPGGRAYASRAGSELRALPRRCAERDGQDPAARGGHRIRQDGLGAGLSAGKKLVAAKRAVEAWRKLVDPSLPEVREAWKEVTSALRQAEELAARARKLERVDPPARAAFTVRAWTSRPTCPTPWPV